MIRNGISRFVADPIGSVILLVFCIVSLAIVWTALFRAPVEVSATVNLNDKSLEILQMIWTGLAGALLKTWTDRVTKQE